MKSFSTYYHLLNKQTNANVLRKKDRRKLRHWPDLVTLEPSIYTLCPSGIYLGKVGKMFLLYEPSGGRF